MTIKKIFYILDSKEKKKLFFLLFLILIVAVLDLIGVASILPFISIVANPELVKTNKYLFNFYNMSDDIFGLENVTEFLVLLGVVMFFLLIIALIMRAILQYFQLRFSLMQEYNIGKRLLEGYLHQPYSWFLNKNTANIEKTILSEVQQIVYQTILPITNLIAQSTVVLAMLTLMILVDYKLALSAGIVLSTFYIIIFYLMKKLVSTIGTNAVKSNSSRFRAVSEAFGAAKEIKLKGLEKNFTNLFAEHAKSYAINQSLAEIIAQLPRFLLEAIVFGGMIIIILILISTNNEFVNIVPILSLYAFAGYRLIPSLQQAYHAKVLLRFSRPRIESIYRDLKSLNYLPTPNSSGKKLVAKDIKLKNIYYNYPTSEKTTLVNLSMNIPALSKVGITGQTGSGKSTVVDIIMGLLDPTKGSLSVDNQVIDSNNKRKWQKNIGYVPQQIYLSDKSILANIAFGVKYNEIDLKRIIEVSKIASIHDFITNELPLNYKTNVGERGIKLSGGQRQRIGIARALYHRPHVLILDEATSSLDSLTEQKVLKGLETIKDEMTIISIAHRLNTLKNCDIIYVLEQGSLKKSGKFNDIFLNQI